MGESSSPGLWRCKRCGAILGAMTRAGHLWLAAEVCDLAQRYTNAVRVECTCGQANVWYTKPARSLREALEALDAADNM